MNRKKFYKHLLALLSSAALLLATSTPLVSAFQIIIGAYVEKNISAEEMQGVFQNYLGSVTSFLSIISIIGFILLIINIIIIYIGLLKKDTNNYEDDINEIENKKENTNIANNSSTTMNVLNIDEDIEAEEVIEEVAEEVIEDENTEEPVEN